MRFLILIIMAAEPGEHIDHYLYEKMYFRDVEECQAFAQTYWQPLTNLAMMAKEKPWGNMYCIPENNAKSELIDNVLNTETI